MEKKKDWYLSIWWWSTDTGILNRETWADLIVTPAQADHHSLSRSPFMLLVRTAEQDKQDTYVLKEYHIELYDFAAYSLAFFSV